MRVRVLWPMLATLVVHPGGAQCPASTRALIDARRFDEAHAAAVAMLQQNPSSDVALHCMGTVAMDSGKPGDAADWFGKAAKANDTVAIHHLRLAQALGLEAEHSSRFKLPFLAHRAKAELDRAAALNPSSIEAHRGLLVFYSRAPHMFGGSSDKAMEQADEIERLDPVQGHHERALLFIRQKNDSAAEHELHAAVAASPADSATAKWWLASFYGSHGRWTDAFAIYEQVIAARPDDPQAHLRYGRASAESGTNLERGEKELRYWLAHMPLHASPHAQATAHASLGRILEHEGRHDDAEAELKTARSIDPTFRVER